MLHGEDCSAIKGVMNINIRAEKCSSQGHYSRYGCYTTGMSWASTIWLTNYHTFCNLHGPLLPQFIVQWVFEFTDIIIEWPRITQFCTHCGIETICVIKYVPPSLSMQVYNSLSWSSSTPRSASHNQVWSSSTPNLVSHNQDWSSSTPCSVSHNQVWSSSIN